MANSGWDGELKSDRFDPDGCFGTKGVPHDTWFDSSRLSKPCTVAEQAKYNGWTYVEMPVDNDGDDDLAAKGLPAWKLPTGMADRSADGKTTYGVAGYVPGGAGGS